MGVDIVTAEFLAYCKTRDVDFARTVTLGRQTLYAEPRNLSAVLRKHGIASRKAAAAGMDEPADHRSSPYEHGFAEGFFHDLGAATVDAVDANDYEGASIIHDMNLPIDDAYAGAFSAVVDGGTLEHVFNFPVAIENCMRMVRTGGHFMSVCPANNYFGHGFYQFSIELFYRVFSEPNGFRVVAAFLSAEKPFGQWYAVPDPAEVHDRITLINQVPTLQLFVAQKTADVRRLTMTPMQSDYSQILWRNVAGSRWTAHGDAQVLRRGLVLHRMASHLPFSAARFLRALRSRVVGAVRPPFGNRHLRRFRP